MVFGCSKCRFAPKGCARCREPSFRPRHAADDKTELREAAKASRRLADATRHEARLERRKREGAQAGDRSRELLLDRLRRFAGTDNSEGEVPTEETATTTKRALSPQATAAAATEHLQPPSKYRKIDTTATTDEVGMQEKLNDDDTGSLADMEIEVEGEEAVSAPTPAAAAAPSTAAAGGAPATGTKRGFLELLEDNMAKRREARLSSSSPSEFQKTLGGLSPAAKRQRRSSRNQASPAKQRVSGDLRCAIWEPPVSPYGLIEEELFEDPWKLLTACLLLNKTTGRQVRQVIWELFKLCPTPQAAIEMDTDRIQTLIQPLGLFRKRAVAFQRMSSEYLSIDWKDPSELHGIGKYASDAYWIFCRGAWREGEVDPEDKDLLKYLEWLRETGGLGMGLQRYHTNEAAEVGLDPGDDDAIVRGD